jgi:hypothetical protein
MALLTSSGISSSLYSVESSDESEVRPNWACKSGLSASGFFWLRLGLVSPAGASGFVHSSPARLSVSEDTDCCEPCRLWPGVKGWPETIFLGLGVLARDA